jgi:uncharacterized Zn finger protein (UPF0148 family)
MTILYACNRCRVVLLNPNNFKEGDQLRIWCPVCDEWRDGIEVPTPEEVKEI